MSIATLKKKTAAKYNNSSVNVPNFSINGGYRNQGWVGQTSLSRSLPRTPMVGNTPRGSGGCCGTYNLTPIIQSGVTSIDDNSVIKSSVVSNDGMIAQKHRWIGRPAPYTSVKPGAGNNLNDQSDYITRKAKSAINESKDCSKMDIPKYVCNSEIYKCDPKIDGHITKMVGPITGGQYVNNLNDECTTTIDKEFQEQNNNSSNANNGTPFAC